MLERDPEGLVVILGGKRDAPLEKLRQRFRRTMAGLDRRIVALPSQTPSDYMRLLSVTDVMLDTIHYGASFVAYDAFAVGLPIITHPSPLPISRYAYAFYDHMDLSELVAGSSEEYVTKAVRLATDRDYREHVSRLIVERSEGLFEDQRTVRDHEKFFEYALGQAKVMIG